MQYSTSRTGFATSIRPLETIFLDMKQKLNELGILSKPQDAVIQDNQFVLQFEVSTVIYLLVCKKPMMTKGTHQLHRPRYMRKPYPNKQTILSFYFEF